MALDALWAWWEKFLCKVCSLARVLLSDPQQRSLYADMSDNELIEHAKQDIDHFSELFDRYYTRVYQFHDFRIRQKQDAEDLTS